MFGSKQSTPTPRPPATIQRPDKAWWQDGAFVQNPAAKGKGGKRR